MKNRDPKIHMISQPLITEGGFINPACINELNAAINNTPETWVRLSENPEWNTPRWTTLGAILGALANSPVCIYDGYPPGLGDVLEYTKACLLQRGGYWDHAGVSMEEISLCAINRELWDILGEMPQFKAWNTKETMGENWLDLSAVLHNVCLIIRDERRHFDTFNKEFET